MAKYRQVHTHIWKDGWFLDLEPSHKLFFIYLFTNERASISGIYELSKRVMSFESGLSMADIDEALDVFRRADKSFYEDGIVWVTNLRKYHETKSPKVQRAIELDLNTVKDCELKRIYCKRYGIDRVSIPRSSSSSSSSSIKVPPDLETNEFDAVWKRWCRHIGEKGKTLTLEQTNETLAELGGMGHDRAIRAIRHSLKKGWLSIYEPQPQSTYQGPAYIKQYVDEIVGHIKQYGSRQKPEFNGNTAKIMRIAGGYPALCNMSLPEAIKAIESAAREVPA